MSEPMRLRPGVVRLDELAKHCQGELYAEMREFDDKFLALCRSTVRRYTLRWGGAPMRLWSRRWEYPYAAQRLIELAHGCQGRELRILDAGSGVTFFPYYVCSRVPAARFICNDSNVAYGEIFRRLNAARGCDRVSFLPGMAQELAIETGSLDAVCCISVLEHTHNYGTILDEFLRVLKPGGLLVLTFDISLDGRTTISRAGAGELLRQAAARFQLPGDFEASRELAALDRPDEILTTDYIRRVDRKMLPWPHPTLKSMYDVLKGRGWSGGFFSITCCCLDARAPIPPGAGRT